MRIAASVVDGAGTVLAIGPVAPVCSRASGSRLDDADEAPAGRKVEGPPPFDSFVSV